MAKKTKLKILFIGNNHTYYHDMPAWVAVIAREIDCECDVTMLAHPDWYLYQHVEQPDVRFNIGIEKQCSLFCSVTNVRIADIIQCF